jgi:hypothetical protein
MQLVFYRWCLDRWRDRHTWIAFIDADEFLYTPGPETFPEILASFEGNDTVGALGVSVHIPVPHAFLNVRTDRRSGKHTPPTASLSAPTPFAKPSPNASPTTAAGRRAPSTDT